MQAGIHLFIEKPLSIKPAEEVARLGHELAKVQKEKHLVIAVGYMLRYASCVQVRTYASYLLLSVKRKLSHIADFPLLAVYSCARSDTDYRAPISICTLVSPTV